MAPRNGFEHLPLPLIYNARAYLHGRGGRDPRTTQNTDNRTEHGNFLRNTALRYKRQWQENASNRTRQQLPPIPRGVPFLLEIDANFDADFLMSYGFEIVSEHDNGYVLVATEDVELEAFMRKIESFEAGNRMGGAAARIYNLVDYENQEIRLRHILSETLLQNWPNINDAQTYIVDVGIECSGTIVIPDKPKQKENESEDRWQIRLDSWNEKYEQAYMAWDELRMQRENDFERFAEGYGGNIYDFTDNGASALPDSFTVRISITGNGLRDLVLNYPFVFEVSEIEELNVDKTISSGNQTEFPTGDFSPPGEDYPRVCIIDSGIQEGHILLSDAIDNHSSHCFLPGRTDINDQCREGGHGTRVASAVLYPYGIPREGLYQFPCWLQNARVLNEENKIPDNLFPPALLHSIIDRYHINGVTKIFNHSIAGAYPCRLQHMSAWAAEIDMLSYNNDVLIIQAAGNLYCSSDSPFRLGIQQHMMAGRIYPDYLLQPSCRIPNPAQSLQALTVGSINKEAFNDGIRSSLGGEGWPCAISSTGPGLWGVIKPDLVEYGGDIARDTGNPPDFSTPVELCPELARTSPPGPLLARDAIGTSFAAPKVAHIAAVLQHLLPEQPCLLYRALIAQSARWSQWAQTVPQHQINNVLKFMGYGLPNLERATSNNPFRVTLMTTGISDIPAGQAHIYRVNIPEEIRELGEEYQILIEITLSYVAKPRRTRKNIRGYLSTWVDWRTSNLGEEIESFCNRTLIGRDHNNTAWDRSIPWTIGSRSAWGQAQGAQRNATTLQKDWAVVPSNQLTEGFCIGVVGHAGWDNDPEARAKYSLVVSFEAINRDIEIYDLIRVEVEAEAEIEITE